MIEDLTELQKDIYSAFDMQKKYSDFLHQSASKSLDLGSWLPELGKIVGRPLVPGELAFILANTGMGKSMCLQQIAVKQSEPILFFEMELPSTLLFERWMQHIHQKTSAEVEASFRADTYLELGKMHHVYCVDKTRLSKDHMVDYIKAFEEANGFRPAIIMVDYIGLMGGDGRSRYEKVSNAAEELKVLAKEANVVVVAATQMSRPEDSPDTPPDLHSAKDSGGIENSCGLLLGLWRDVDGGHIKVLKNTKGRSGDVIDVMIDGEHMTVKSNNEKQQKELNAIDGERYR